MGINAVGQGSAAIQSATTTPTSTTASTQAASSASGSKKDTAVVSQKAKDLAALKAGKSMQEEASESMSAKLEEAAGA